MNENEVRKMAEEHWSWLEKVLLKQLEMQRMLYIEAIIHGYKHAVHDLNDKKEKDFEI